MHLGFISLASPPASKMIPTLDKCQVIISKEKTPTKFLGEGSKQAHYWNAGFSDVDAPENKIFQFKPSIENPKDHIMLQIADLAAYICCKARSGKDQFFREQLTRINHGSGVPFPTNHPNKQIIG